MLQVQLLTETVIERRHARRGHPWIVENKYIELLFVHPYINVIRLLLQMAKVFDIAYKSYIRSLKNPYL